jgi:peptide-methionine (S)-S-oxide reductase
MNNQSNPSEQAPVSGPSPDGAAVSEATFGNGCFWCTEAFFSELNGVLEVSPGYSGGPVKNPAYREVCNGTTGHAEVVRIRFDPARISFPELLEVFWATHDPTTLNRQGNDVGTQYRSAIFFHDEEQQRLANVSKMAAEESGVFSGPIVTEISPLVNYFPAEDYHRDYFARNPNAPYCSVMIAPKMAGFRQRFAEKLASGADSKGA